MNVHEDSLSEKPSCQDPISALPDELLSEILSLATQAHDDYQDCYFYPSVLCLVSRHWREVTVASPRVWTFILIKNPRDLGHLRSRLARAKSVPLDVRILDSYGHIQPSDLIDILLPSGRQWLTLHLEVPKICDYTTSFPDALPLLRRITFADGGARFSLNISLPRLACMRLINTCLFWEPSMMIPSLTEFRAEGHGFGPDIRLEGLLAQLGCFPNLEVLELIKPWDFEILEPAEFKRLGHLVFPQLRKLRIDPLYSWELVALLSLLHMPALQTLMLNISANGPNAPMAFQVDQLRLNVPCLQTIMLEDHRIPEKDLRHLLLQMPSIHQLYIMNGYHNQMGLALKDILSNPELAKISSRLSVLACNKVKLADLHDILSSAGETSRTFTSHLTLKVYPGRGRLDPDNKILDDLRGLVARVEYVDEELWWDSVVGLSSRW